MSHQFERIQAGQVRPGDRVAHTRRQEPTTIAAIAMGPRAVKLLTSEGRTYARPRHTTPLWRVVDEDNRHEA